MNIRILQFIAIILTALALVPGGAHALELLNKLALDRDQYMMVQSIYRGWALLGIVLIGALAANGVLAVRTRRRAVSSAFAAAAAVLVAITLAVFFTWTFPANQLTGNWTITPVDWQTLRTQWEYSHAANAVLTFLALCATTISVLTWRR
jgi:predicted small integral membrane protein